MLKYPALLVLACSLVACTYYRVTDPTSGRVYFTDKVERYKSSGAIGFLDKRTGQNITLSSSEFVQISEKEYKELTKKLNATDAQKE